jgi:peroxiredoxin
MWLQNAEVLRRAWRAKDSWVVLGLLALSLGLNVYLGIKIGSVQAAPDPVLVPGAEAPRLEAENLKGGKVRLDWSVGTQPTLLYVFSPSCVWCQRNFANFDVLSHARRSNYRIIGLSTTSEGLNRYVESHGISYEIYANPDVIKNKDFLIGTPATFLISPSGVVEAVWRGAYTGKTKDEIEAKLAVHLPGLVADASH